MLNLGKKDQPFNLKTEQLIQENGLVMKEMEMEFKFGVMELNIKVNGKIIRRMEKENLNMQMEIFSKENGKMVKQTV